MATVDELLGQACARIDRFDARVLLSHLLSCPKEKFIAHPEMQVDDSVQTEFLCGVDRIAQGEPVAYLVGFKSFWNRDFTVSPAVLIPRPDTETLIEHVLEAAEFDPAPDILELGTGSGCIAITLALELPQAHVTATDLSHEALAIAKGNAARLEAHNISFSEGSWYFAVDDGARFDIIVSNPPYIQVNDEHLSALKFEPTMALTDGRDGLSCVRAIVKNALSHLRPGALLLIEHGYDQGEAVADLFRAAGLEQVESFKDLGGNDRITTGKAPAGEQS